MSRDYLRSQVSALLGNASRPVKFVCCGVVLFYLLSFSERAVDLLAITPGYLLPPSFCVWTAFTFCFLELHLWEVCADVITVGLCGKLIEPLWGRRETFVFFAVTNLGVAATTTAYYLFVYMCTRNTDYLFSVRVHGLAGYVAAVSVAVKQIMPDHLLIDTPLGKMTNRVIPLLVFIVALCLWAVGFLEGSYPCMWVSGTIVSWVYLRFWQRHNNGTRGDAAENFGFDNFFPTVTQPLIRAILRPFEKCLVRLGVCPATRKRVHLALSPGGLTITLPGVEPQDMERRRQIALKALSERLSKTSEQAHHKSRPAKVPPFHPVPESGNVGGYIPRAGSQRDFSDGASPTPEATIINIDSAAPTTTLNQQTFAKS